MDWLERLASNDQVGSVLDLAAAGLSRHTVRTRVRAGRWQLAAPGIIVAQSGPLTTHQRWRVGLVHGGAGAALSHRTAAQLHDLRVAETVTEIIVPHGRHKASGPTVAVHQSLRPFASCWRQGFACTGPARTVVDVACALPALRDVRALVTDAIQRGLVRLSDVREEAELAPRRGSRWLRQVLDEAEDGARSPGEAEFMTLVAQSGLPIPEFNATIRAAAGTRVVDGLWRDYRLAAEVDGREWHLGAEEWAQDLRRQNVLQIAGVSLLRFPVSRIRSEPARVLNEIRAALVARGWGP
jgi:very-short-patch-repair endonuclease